MVDEAWGFFDDMQETHSKLIEIVGALAVNKAPIYTFRAKRQKGKGRAKSHGQNTKLYIFSK